MNNNIALYHPNSKNTGFAVSFSQSPKDNAIFATLIRQSGWNDSTKTGSFKESRNDPDKMVSIKLGQTEIGSILDCLDRNREFSTVHDSDRQLKAIRFSTWMSKDEKPIQKGFSFSITVSDKEDSSKKNSLYLGLTFGEGRLVREFLIYCLQKSFESVKQEQEVI